MLRLLFTALLCLPGPSVALAAPRRLFIATNWKGAIETPKEADALVESMNKAYAKLSSERRDAVEISIHPPYPFLDRVKRNLDKNMVVGSQNSYDASFPNIGQTGTTTSKMVASLGCDYVLLGHSDRRNSLGEKDDLIAAKVKDALENDLGICLCLGELKEQREDGKTLAVLFKQLSAAAAVVPNGKWDCVVLAYEPVWAVGEGAEPCAPQETQRIHTKLREWIRDNVSKDAAEACRITYTGSVNEDNAAGYAALSQVDGFVLGRAGLEASKLVAIVSTLVDAKNRVEEL